MENWNIGSLLHRIEKNEICEIKPSWIEKISTALLISASFGKTPLPFRFWPVRYLPTFHYSSIPLFHAGGINQRR